MTKFTSITALPLNKILLLQTKKGFALCFVEFEFNSFYFRQVSEIQREQIRIANYLTNIKEEDVLFWCALED